MTLKRLTQIVKKGSSGELQFSDFREGIFLSTKQLKDRIENNWRKNHVSKNLLSAFVSSFKIPLAICLTIRIFDRCFLMALERILLGQVVTEIPKCAGGNCATSILLSFILITTTRCILQRIFYFWIKITCKEMRVGMTALLYNKILRLSEQSLSSLGAGKLVNLVANGATTLENSFYIPSLLSGPLQILALFYVLWLQFGLASGIGMGVLVIFGISQSYLGRLSANCRAKVAAATSIRTQWMTQIISGIKTIKLQAMESLFIKIVLEIRREECSHLKDSNILEAVRMVSAISSPILAMIVTVSSLEYFGEDISAEKIIVASTIFYHLRVLIFIDIPMGVKQLGSFINVSREFEEVMLLEEVAPSKNYLNTAKGEIIIDNLVLRSEVNKDSEAMLQNGNLKVSSGHLLQLIGKTGSGKTTLLKSILGEFPFESGKIEIGGRISYAAQEPWIFPGTVQENILFHSKFLPLRYKKVLSACALSYDLKSLEYKDQTLLGEGGSELSGGQIARIALARAIYAEADIFLIDDILCKVDANVGNHIFHHCINGFLKTKTIILVSGGKQNFSTLRPIKNETSPGYSNDCRIKTTECSNNNTYITNTKKRGSSDLAAKRSSKSTTAVYWRYLTISSGLGNVYKYSLLTIVLMVIYQTIEHQLQKRRAYTSHYQNSIGIICMIATAVAQSIFLLRVISNGRKYFHDTALSKLLSASIQTFYKSVPGEILERFTVNLSVVDEVLAFKLHDVIYILGMYSFAYMLLIHKFGALITMPIILLFTIGFYVQKWNLKICQQLIALSQKATDPVISWVTSTVTGITTIRALDKCKEMEAQYDACLDLHLQITLTQLIVEHFSTLLIDLASIGILNMFVLAAMFFPLPGVETLLSPLLSFGATIGYAFALGTELTINAKHADSILQLHELKPELEGEVIDDNILENWPCKGQIVVSNLTFYYVPGIPILKNLNFSISAGENIAIIGRTGSGKSTLVAALVRLVTYAGDVVIDGVNTAKISLKRHREGVFVIPQDSQIFQGTLRFHLDPYEKYSDKKIIEALKLVKMHDDCFAKFSKGLDTEVTCNSFSCGHWQLLNLAKAILADPKILIFDESMAHIDKSSTEILMKELRSFLPNTTMITILHNLEFINYYDRVMVIAEGEITEFGPPSSIRHLSSE